MFKKTPIAAAISSAAFYSAIAVTGSVAPTAVFADDGEASIEEVVVTGSRIKRSSFTASSPVATLGAEQISISNTINMESLLNTLPQAIPGFDRTSNNPGNGTATVNLRGLGTNRTLVLIDGKRVVPTTAGGAVDINTIPAAMIERVEVLTGGASAIYGSDAVAGVVNFIFKDDFEGVVIDTGYEATEKGDAELFSTDITIGGNFADGRGNAIVNFHYTDRQDLFQGDRDFSTFAQFDDTDANGNPILIDGGSSGIPGLSIFSGALGGFSPDSFGVTFDPDGSIRPFETGEVNDFYNYAPVNYIQLPQERYQTTAKINYGLTEDINLYGRVMFTSSSVPQQLAPTPIFQTAEFTIDDSPFLSSQAQTVLSDAFGSGTDTDGDGIDDTGTAFLRRRLLEVGPRIAESDFSSFQIQVGVEGDINDDWSFDIYAQTGEVELAEIQAGNVNRDRFQQALLLDLDADPTGATCTDTGSNGATVGCSGLNVFGQGNISENAAEFLRVATNANAVFDQTTIGASVSGSTGENFKFPSGGSIGIAAGYEYIDYQFDFKPSQDLATGTIAGFSGQPAIAGGYDVTSFFGEIYLPILEGVQGAESLDAELAFRQSDYSSVGNVSSMKLAASWAPVEDVRFRVSFNEAVRAPNIGELFTPPSEGFPGATDPCASSLDPSDAATAAICSATGVPASALGTPAIDLPAGQVRAIFGGNPNLAEEEAETFTYGIVWQPSQEALEGFSLSVDYFDIEIEEAVGVFGGGANNVLSICYDPSNPNGGVGSQFCNAISRRADGTIDFVDQTSANSAVTTLKGWDVIGEYVTEAWGGIVDVRYVGTVTDEADFTPFIGAETLECAGTFGLDCGEPTPEYKHRMTFGYTRDEWSAQLTWRLIGEVDDDDDTTTYFVETVDTQHYLDFAGSYSFNDTYSVTVGIDNLLDEEPPIIGDNQEQANTYPATYDVFGRTYFVRFRAAFGEE